MNYIKILAILILVSVMIMNCSEDTPLEPPPPETKLSTFSEIQRQVFDGAGCNNSGCHSGNNPAVLHEIHLCRLCDQLPCEFHPDLSIRIDCVCGL